MAENETLTATCLMQWHGGREEGLQALLERHLPWVRERIEARLAGDRRGKAATCDCVRHAVVQFLTFAPKFTIASEEALRGLLLEVAANGICNRTRWFVAKRRAMAKERPLPPETVLSLDPPPAGAAAPDQEIAPYEQGAWIRLGMEFLEDGMREVLVLRDWEGLAFVEIAARLGLSEHAAWLRHRRGLERLGDVVWLLRSGSVAWLLSEAPAVSPGA